MADDVSTVASPPSSLPVDTSISTQQQTDLSHRQNIRLVDGTKDSANALAIDDTGHAKVVADALPLPTGAATETTLASVLAKLSADPATQTTLAAILAKIIAAPATEAKQDSGNTSLASILAALADQATAANQATEISALAAILGDTDAILAKLSSDPATQTTLAAILAKLSSDPATQTTLAAILTKLNASLAVTGTFWQATQPVSGPLTDTELRASRVPVDPSGVTSPVSAASLPLPTGAATEATLDTRTGSLTETPPTTDTASSGLNGRLQRIAQRITSLIGLLPTALGAHGGLVIEGVASGVAVPVSGSLTSSPSTASTATLTNVNAAASDTSLLASNGNRLAAFFFNDSTAILYLSLGAGAASTTSYTVQVPPGGYYELPTSPFVTCAVRGIWSAAAGSVRITEMTA